MAEAKGDKNTACASKCLAAVAFRNRSVDFQGPERGIIICQTIFNHLPNNSVFSLPPAGRFWKIL